MQEKEKASNSQNQTRRRRRREVVVEGKGEFQQTDGAKIIHLSTRLSFLALQKCRLQNIQKICPLSLSLSYCITATSEHIPKEQLSTTWIKLIEAIRWMCHLEEKTFRKIPSSKSGVGERKKVISKLESDEFCGFRSK